MPSASCRREAERLLASGKDNGGGLQVPRDLRTDLPALEGPVPGQPCAPEVARLKALERENRRLKKIVADLALDIDMLKEVARGNF